MMKTLLEIQHSACMYVLQLGGVFPRISNSADSDIDSNALLLGERNKQAK